LTEGPVLRADDVSYQIGDAQILESVALELPRGSVTTVLGPNGAGKTSLLRCLSLLAMPSAGRVRILDRDYEFPSERPAVFPWPDLTVVFQSLHLWPHLTLRENVTLPVILQNNGSVEAADMRIEQLELAALADRYPSEVSGGERQRAAIARALALEPKILFLDEPTSATDVEHAVALSDILREESMKGLTVLLITHLIGFAKTVSDHVLFVDRGRIAARGGAEIIDSPPTDRMRRFVSVF
jgi:ABC-type polar amino acid transport system ATPase subunit